MSLIFFALFAFDDIKEVWTMIKQKINHNIAYQEDAEQVFLDILSIVATNPCVRYISNIVKVENDGRPKSIAKGSNKVSSTRNISKNQ